MYVPPALFTSLTTAIGNDPAFKSVFPDGPDWFTSASLNNCTVLQQTSDELDAALPRVTLTFGTGSTIEVETLPTQSYLVAVDGIAPTTCWVPGIATIPGFNCQIMGVSFMRSRIFIFDRANKRLGLAAQQPCP